MVFIPTGYDNFLIFMNNLFSKFQIFSFQAFIINQRYFRSDIKFGFTISRFEREYELANVLLNKNKTAARKE
jgi:hypothetical protein